MCGIFGYILKKQKHQDIEGVIRDLCFVGTLRGFDSTGFAFGNNKTTNIQKTLSPGHDTIHLPMFKNIISNIKTYNYFIGHHRKATKGSITIENAHPFNHNHITLVHNGGVYSLINLYEKLQNFKNFATDSETICHALSIAKDPLSVLPRIQGAYCLVWYNEREKTINIVRNNERPMSIAILKNGYIFASEYEMLRFAIDRNQIKVEEYIQNIPTHSLYTFPLNKPKQFTKKEYTPSSNTHLVGINTGINQIDKERINYTRLLNRQVVVEIYEVYRNNYLTSAEGYVLDDKNNIMVVINDVAKDVKTGDLVDVKITSYVPRAHQKPPFLIGRYITTYLELKETTGSDDKTLKGPNGKRISKKEFEKLTKRGCAYCGGNLNESDADLIIWTFEGDPICDECQECTAVAK